MQLPIRLCKKTLRSRTLFDRRGAFAEYVDGELVWVRPGYGEEEKNAGPQVVRDLAPYQSMIDGSLIDGRKRHRDHLRAHGCIELGNETPKPRQQTQTRTSLKESLHRVLADVGDRDMRQIVNRTLKDLR